MLVMTVVAMLATTVLETCLFIVYRCEWFDFSVHGRFLYNYDIPLEWHPRNQKSHSLSRWNGALGTKIRIHCGTCAAHVAA